MTNERDFKGIWIPKEILTEGIPTIFQWVNKEYGINLYLEKSLQEDK